MKIVKKLSSTVKQLIKKLSLKRIFYGGLLLILGISIGWCATFFSMRNDKNTTIQYSKNKPSAIQMSPEEIKKRTSEGLDKTYDKLKERVKTDLERKELPKEQAETIYKKQKEAYEYRKGLKLESSEDQQNFAQKRAEWRKWIQENKMSPKYFSGLL